MVRLCSENMPYRLLSLREQHLHQRVTFVSLFVTRYRFRPHQGCNEEGQRGAIPRAPSHYGAPNHYGGRRMVAGGAEKSQQCHKYLPPYSSLHLLPKHLSFEHGGAKLASCPGRYLKPLHPWATYPSSRCS